MTGRPGHRTIEMNGGSSAPYLACTPCVPLFCTSFSRGGNRSAFGLPGAGGGSFPLYGGTFARSYSVSINGTRLMVHAGSRRQFFGQSFVVFFLFLVCCWEVLESGERSFFSLFLQFFCRFFPRVPLSTYHY